MSNPYRHIYPELWQARRPEQGPTPVFPEACPACSAPAVEHGKLHYHPVTYACGGGYDEKPQIQNHTDKWWGYCPVTKLAIEQE